MINKKADWKKWNSKESNFNKKESINSTLVYGKHLNRITQATIIILSYKRVDGLRRALDSALKQDYKENYEILVLDDSGELSKIDNVMKKYCSENDNVIYYRHDENLGEPGNWNRAAKICKSKWYCLLHDDDELMPNYLSTIMDYTSDALGMIGVYNQEKNYIKENKKVINKFVNIFIELRRGKIIPLKINDNIKDIYVLSTCLFLNRDKVLDIGGSNDDYFPTSDFVFASKMNYYYNIAFLPKILAYRGVYDNQSLKLEVCNDSIRCAYYHTIEMCKMLKYTIKNTKRKASIAAVIAEIGVKGYNDVNYGDVKKELGMKDIYNNKLMIFLINIYSKFNWGKLLFRRSL